MTTDRYSDDFPRNPVSKTILHMKTLHSTSAQGQTPPAQLSGRHKTMLLLLVMCIVQFFSAWIYPAYSFGMAVVSGKTYAVPFQYCLWVLILVVVVQMVRRQGIASFGAVLGPFLPLLLIGFAAAAFGIDPIGGLRSLMLWCIMAIGAVAIADGLPPERLLRALLATLTVLLLLSIIWSVAVPSYGVMGGSEGRMWRGLFVGKNAFGWVAALALVVAAGAYQPDYRRLPLFAVLLAVICLLGSDSKGALVAAVVAVMYGYWVPRLMRRVTPGFGIALIIGGVVCLVILMALALPILLDLLGRDITLTGRTSIWKMYFLSMTQTPWLGQGPGAYTAPSALTSILAYRLNELGVITTPHSIYLGVLGDAGLFGLVAFLGLMLYMSLIAPARHRGALWMLSGTIGVLMMVDGLVETHEIFSPGPGWFLLILLRAAAMRNDKLIAGLPQQSSAQVVDGRRPVRMGHPLPYGASAKT